MSALESTENTGNAEHTENTGTDGELPAFPLPPAPDEYGTPAGEHARRRCECPIDRVALPSGDPAHLVVRYDDVAAVLRDRRASRNLRYPGAPRMVRQADMNDNPDAIVNHDPPEHTRFRQIIQVAFSPSREPAWIPVVRRVVGDLLDGIAEQGQPADLVSGFAAALPIRVMCELMGVPAADHQLFAGWTATFFAVDTSIDERRLKANQEFVAYLRAMFEQRRAEPGGDLIDDLIAARDQEGRLSEPELLQMVAALLIGGQENTAATLARGVLTLLRHPGQFAALRDAVSAGDESLLESAVEEILRFEVPGEGAFLRVATEDLALSGGTIHKGAAIQASLPSANRDETRFAEPGRFDIRRSPNPHLTFGLGAHFCPGAPLARVELRTALAALVTRFPGLELAVPVEDVSYGAGLLLRPLVALPVRW